MRAGSGNEVKGGERRAGDDTAAAARERKPDVPRESWLQIAVTWVSGLLLLTVAIYLVWEGTRPFTPASFSADVREVREFEGSHFVRLEVSNVGGQSVQGLGVVLELRRGEEVVERASGVLDWLPEGSSRQLVLIVERDPQQFTPVVTYDAYQVP